MSSETRYVVLSHNWPTPHLDLLLERNGVLKGWRLPTSFRPSEPTPVELAPDHRLLYLDYEGVVSGKRGSVTRWDWGELEWERIDPDCVTFRLRGQRLNGQFELARGGGVWVLRLA